jgi:two-component system sensor kinase FixL
MSKSGQAIAERGRLDGGREIDPHVKTAIQTILAGSTYILAYIVLDWMSFVESNQLANYSWNPNSGASFAAILIFGRPILPFLFVAPILGDAVTGQSSLPLSYELASGSLIGGIYGATALFFLDARSSFDRTLQSMSSVVLLVITTVVSALLVAATHIGLIIVAGLLTTADFAVTTASYWVGEVIGILVVTPVALLLWTKRYAVWGSGETLLQLAGIVAALVVAHIYWTAEHLRFFYILFVPIVWMAVRTGIEGVCLGLLVTQLCFIISFHALPNEISEMPKMQGLMLVLAFTGLFAGGLVTERRRTEAALRLHQESLARLARLGSMGELAAAMAHELNQPLMAAYNYTRLVDDALRTGRSNPDATAETARKAAAQVERAVAVVKRLRALVRLDQSNPIACRVDRVVRETIALCQPDLDRAGVKIRRSVAVGLPLVMVDMLQIEQALLNLIRNSIDAIREAGQGTIAIEAALKDADFVVVSVRDSGPGFPPDRVANPFLPLSSTKQEGLGVGLSLCRSLIEANGGRIWLDAETPGATMHFTLPVAPVRSPPVVLP